MVESFYLAPIAGDRILQAYVLVREAGNDLTVEAWREFARTMLDSGLAGAGGIIGLCSGNGYLRGLFTYMVIPDVRSGRVLHVEYFAVDSVFSAKPLAQAMLVGVESVARKNDCPTIRTHFPDGLDWLVDVMRERGYAEQSSYLSKQLPAAIARVPGRA